MTAFRSSRPDRSSRSPIASAAGNHDATRVRLGHRARNRRSRRRERTCRSPAPPVTRTCGCRSSAPTLRGVPPCARTYRMAISPGFSRDPDTIAPRVSRMRCLASGSTAGGSVRSPRARTMYRAKRAVTSATRAAAGAVCPRVRDRVGASPGSDAATIAPPASRNRRRRVNRVPRCGVATAHSSTEA